MSARIIIDLPAGRKVLLGGGGPNTGLADVGMADEVVRITGDKFKAALGSLADLVAAMEQSLGQMAHRPDKVEMEFGATLSSACDLWIVSGEGEAEFKITLAWGKGD